MKQFTKKIHVLFYFCLALQLTSCSVEENVVKKINHKKIDFKEKSFKEALSIPIFSDSYKKVAKNKGEFKNEDDARTALEDQYGFTIVTDSPVRIITDENGTIFYTILIEREVKQELIFENLIIKVTDNGTAAAIFKYTMTEKGNLTDDSNYVFNGYSSSEFTDLNIEGKMFFNSSGQTCFDVFQFLCDDALGYTHVAYGACFQNGTAYAVISSTCMNDGNVPTQVVLNNNSVTVSNGGGGAEYQPLTTIAIPCHTANCMEIDEIDEVVPCVGDPIKNPRICPSSPTNIEGGTFGCTRNSNKVCEGISGKKKHGGIDILLPPNKTIFSMYSGYVVSKRSSFGSLQYAENSLGNYVEIESVINGDLVRIKYCHMGSTSLENYDYITQGSPIGLSGKSGNAAAKGVTAHLHIQAKIKIGNTWLPINPQVYLDTIFSSVTFEPIGSASNCN